MHTQTQIPSKDVCINEAKTTYAQERRTHRCKKRKSDIHSGKKRRMHIYIHLKGHTQTHTYICTERKALRKIKDKNNVYHSNVEVQLYIEL